jgi:hypothetical protein
VIADGFLAVVAEKQSAWKLPDARF